jgi:hypothetical protein
MLCDITYMQAFCFITFKKYILLDYIYIYQWNINYIFSPIYFYLLYRNSFNYMYFIVLVIK